MKSLKIACMAAVGAVGLAACSAPATEEAAPEEAMAEDTMMEEAAPAEDAMMVEEAPAEAGAEAAAEGEDPVDGTTNPLGPNVQE